MTVRSDRRYTFDADRAVVWAALIRVEEYRSWWPWLRRFDGTSFTVGERWQCAVKSPLPYTMQFEIHLTEVIDGERAGAELTGDVDGWAELDLTAEGDDGCRLRLVSELAASRGAAGLVDRFARPLATIGHDWVLDNGIRQFRKGALGSS